VKLSVLREQPRTYWTQPRIEHPSQRPGGPRSSNWPAERL
jgi:hypothetical protein